MVESTLGTARGEAQGAVAVFSDGAAGIGTLHECTNMAAIWKLPLVFVCENNGYAQSTSFEYGSAVPSVAGRAAACFMPGIQVDEHDAIAVWQAECLTYRYDEHHQTDNTSRYRLPTEEEAASSRDCVAVLRARIESLGVAGADELHAVEAESKSLLEQAMAFARSSELLPACELTTEVYVQARGERRPPFPRHASSRSARRSTRRCGRRRGPIRPSSCSARTSRAGRRASSEPS